MKRFLALTSNLVSPAFEIRSRQAPLNADNTEGQQ
jgi:hypothetical protein